MRARWEADSSTRSIALGSIFPPQTLFDIHDFQASLAGDGYKQSPF